jgi:hypothetical protein
MNKIVTLLLMIFVLLPLSGFCQMYLTTTDQITISGRTLDSSGFYTTPDSVRIVVYHDGAEEYDVWYNSADAQCSAINDMLVFNSSFGDIDNDAGDGLYEVMAGFFKDAGDLYYWKTIWMYLGVDMNQLAEVKDSIEAWDDNIAAIPEILDSLQSQDDWVSTLTAAQVWNYLLTAYGDSSSNMAGYLLKIQDSANWASLDDVWRNRDTIDIDSSDIGVWLSGNLKNDFDATTDSVLAKANVLRIGNSLAAAESLMVMMTDSGYVLKLGGIRLRALNSGDTAFIATGSGSGFGGIFHGGSVGTGLVVEAGAGGGYGLFTRGSGNGYAGIMATGNTGNVHGIYALRTGTGNDIFLGGNHRVRGSIDSIGNNGVAVIADGVWNEDTTGHYSPPHMAYMASQTGSGGGGADTVAIKAMHQNNPGLIIIDDTLAGGEQVAVMPDDWSATDSTAYQGAASGLDSNKVAQVFNSFGWGIDSSLHLTYLVVRDSADSALLLVSNYGGGDALQFNALSEGDGIDINTTAGRDIDADIDGTIDSVNYLKRGVSCCSGSGAKSYTIYVADSTDGAATLLSGVMVTAYSMSGDLQAGMKTDSYGKVTYATDLDSLILIVSKFNYHTTPDTIVVSTTGFVDTAYVYHGTIPTSGSPDLCRLYGFIYDISGNPDENATVSAWLPAGVSRYDSSIISPFRVETTTDSTGYFYLDLIPNVNLIPDTSRYEITIVRTDGTVLRERVAIPDEESWRLSW